MEKIKRSGFEMHLLMKLQNMDSETLLNECKIIYNHFHETNLQSELLDFPKMKTDQEECIRFIMANSDDFFVRNNFVLLLKKDV